METGSIKHLCFCDIDCGSYFDNCRYSLSRLLNETKNELMTRSNLFFSLLFDIYIIYSNNKDTHPVWCSYLNLD